MSAYAVASIAAVDVNPAAVAAGLTLVTTAAAAFARVVLGVMTLRLLGVTVVSMSRSCSRCKRFVSLMLNNGIQEGGAHHITSHHIT